MNEPVSSEPTGTALSNTAPPGSPSWGRRLLWLGGFLVSTVVLVGAARVVISPDHVSKDFLAFWTPATLIAAGENPYDMARQEQIQQGIGLTGFYCTEKGCPYLPYYYPPWLALSVMPLLALDYPTAKLVWLVLSAQMLLLSAFLVHRSIPGSYAPLCYLLAVAFPFSTFVLILGQTSNFLLALAALAWWLLTKRRDALAGAALAVLTVKPQLAFVLVGMVLVWSLRERRYAVVAGFAATLAAILAGSTLVVPDWLPQMLAAQRSLPMPTFTEPGTGATWYCVLAGLGFRGGTHTILYAAVAIPIALGLARMGLVQRRSLAELFSAAMLAPFFLSPYARGYDYTFLLLPALVLVHANWSWIQRGMLAFTLTVGSFLFFAAVVAHKAKLVGEKPQFEYTYFWIPLLLGALWLYCAADRSREKGFES